MSQHAHQEDSMIEGKEHGIWCQKEQVQFLYPLLPYLSLWQIGVRVQSTEESYYKNEAR